MEQSDCRGSKLQAHIKKTVWYDSLMGYQEYPSKEHLEVIDLRKSKVAKSEHQEKMTEWKLVQQCD